jgi:hypothetical protein
VFPPTSQPWKSSGVAPGTNFTFNVGGTTVTVPAGPAPGGTASAPIVVPAGPVLITETVPPGTTLTSVSTLQAGSLVSSNLAAGTATVTVAAGGQTIVTFVDTVPPSSTSTPSFSNLSAPTITYGTSTTTISGHLGASSPFPTGSVSITINGVTKTPSLASDGSFSTTFDTHALPVTASGYTIAFSYAGDSNYTSATGSSTLTNTRKALFVTANSTSKTVGTTLTFKGTEFTTSGLQNGETVGSVTLSSAGAAATATVGSFSITVSAATGGTFNAANYAITYVEAVLIVWPTRRRGL